MSETDAKQVATSYPDGDLDFVGKKKKKKSKKQIEDVEEVVALDGTGKPFVAGAVYPYEAVSSANGALILCSFWIGFRN